MTQFAYNTDFSNLQVPSAYQSRITNLERLACRAAKLLSFVLSLMLGVLLISSPFCHAQALAETSVHEQVMSAELKTVKLYGAGGLGLDAYQSGFFISADGHILTVWSTVLDVAEVIAVTADGRRLRAQVIGIDPNLELAVLKADQAPPAFFALQESEVAEPGQRVLAISNLFGIAAAGEMSSVQKGVIMTITDLKARRGNFQSIYQGPALLLDTMTNNPGAAGGALMNLAGQLLGILGKELRDSRANIWINYALPVKEFRQSVLSIMEGKSIARSSTTRKAVDRPTSLALLGITLIPNVLAKTPAFVDLVERKSRADRAGLQSDDLILFVNAQRVATQNLLVQELSFIDRGDPLVLLVQRGTELREVMIQP